MLSNSRTSCKHLRASFLQLAQPLCPWGGSKEPHSGLRAIHNTSETGVVRTSRVCLHCLPSEALCTRTAWGATSMLRTRFRW